MNEFGIFILTWKILRYQSAELDERLSSIMAVTPRAGESYISGSLIGSGLRIERWRIRERLQATDAVGKAARRSRTIRRPPTMCTHSHRQKSRTFCSRIHWSAEYVILQWNKKKWRRGLRRLIKGETSSIQNTEWFKFCRSSLWRNKQKKKNFEQISWYF